MDKVLLVTLQGNFNFGNRLQNYALHRVIEGFGFHVDNLTYRPQLIQMDEKRRKCRKWAIKKFLRKTINEKRFSELRREIKCADFSQRYARRKLIPYEQIISRDWSDYAFAVTGSDQVWHNWGEKALPDELAFYYLQFIDESKRLSYAPSFGFSQFPEEDVERHREGLMGMRALSCREEEGCRLIRELTGRDACKVVDPVLLLTSEEWADIERRPRFGLHKPYLLQFFLGTITPEYREEMDRIRKEKGLSLLNINDPADPAHYGISPSEFLWLIHHADTVCTDSFHASAFSVLFKRNLRVFARVQEGYTDMFGRLQDLLEPLDLMCLAFGVGDGSRLSTDLSFAAMEHLKVARDTSLAYLSHSLMR